MKTEEQLKHISSVKLKECLARDYEEMRKFAAVFLDLCARQYDGTIFRADVRKMLNDNVEEYADLEQEIFLIEKILNRREKNKTIDENNLS